MSGEERKRIPGWVAPAVGLSLSCAIVVAAIIFIRGLSRVFERPEPRPFDSETWKSKSNRCSDIRESMVEDLGDRVMKVGMTRGEVHQLLGEVPLDRERLRERHIVNGTGLGLTFLMFDVYYDSDLRVTGWEVARQKL